MINPEELLNRLYKRAEEGYYEDKPSYQFSKDELDLMYYLGLVDEVSYNFRKQRLTQMINDDYYFNNHYNSLVMWKHIQI